MKPLVIYHASCADGYGAATAAWMKLGDGAEYVAKKYGDDAQEVFNHPAREVYIVDFSFPRDMMEDIIAYSTKVIWLDHHKTAFEMWTGEYKRGAFYKDESDKHYFILDDNKSGALLTFEYFFPDVVVPQLFRTLDDYDRWQFKIEGTKEISKAIWSHAPWSFPQWAVWATDSAMMMQLYAEGRTLLKAHEGNVTQVVKGAMMDCVIRSPLPIDAATYEPGPNPSMDQWLVYGKAANCPSHLSSDVGHQLALESGTFGLVWVLKRDGKVACSLRSNGEYDVSVIAKCFGGGGHKNAAGFEAPSVSTLWTWLIPSSR